MLKLMKKRCGINAASGAIRTARWLLLAFILGPNFVAGNNINAPDTVGNVGRFTSLALDVKGNPVVSYHDLTNRDLKLLHCDDPYCEGDESGNISIPDTAGIVGTYTSLALDVTGKPIVSYCDAFDGNLKLLHCDNSDCSRSSISIPDSLNTVGKYTSIALDAKGNPVVSYYDSSNGDLKLLHCDDPGCTGDESSNISTPDTTGDVGSYTSLVLDAAGNPVISYWASKIGLKILHCDDPKCEGDESSNIAIPDTGEVGWFSSLVLDAAGNPVVGYYDFSSGDLKILHCDDPNCAGDESKNITAPDTDGGGVASTISMVLDAKGNPVVSYYDSSKGQLKILHCDDPNCTGDETGSIATPTDAAGNVGMFASLVLDAAGNPVVSYYDFSNGNLNILHCANQTCNIKKR
jgi:hypothetical protein